MVNLVLHSVPIHSESSNRNLFLFSCSKDCLIPYIIEWNPLFCNSNIMPNRISTLHSKLSSAILLLLSPIQPIQSTPTSTPIVIDPFFGFPKSDRFLPSSFLRRKFPSESIHLLSPVYSLSFPHPRRTLWISYHGEGIDLLRIIVPYSSAWSLIQVCNGCECRGWVVWSGTPFFIV